MRIYIEKRTLCGSVPMQRNLMEIALTLICVGFCVNPIEYEPKTICEHLQYLFALLQNSNRRYIDPSGLVKALGLDTGQQQVNRCMCEPADLFFLF